MGERVVSKLTSKYQTTVPASVRQTLGLTKGDSLVFETSPYGVVTVRRALPLDAAWAQALTPTLSEWDSAEDHKAYRGL